MKSSTPGSIGITGPIAVLDERKRIIAFLLLIVCGMILFFTTLRNPGDFDIWWHLRMGMDWAENGLSPWIDHYSFTYHGEPISGPPVLFQAVLWQLTDWFGERGGQVLVKCLSFGAVFGLMAILLVRLRAPAIVWMIVLPLLVGALQMRVMVRPELGSYVLSMVALLLYQRSQLQLKVSTMLPVVLLLLFWTLYHNNIFGYVIFFGLFIDIALRLIKEKATAREWGKWSGWGALAFAAGFANENFSPPVIGIFFFATESPWGDYISEYSSTIDGLRNVAWAGQIVPWLLFITAISASIISIFTKRVGYAIVLAVFIYAGITMNRMATPAAIVALAIFADLISDSDIWIRLRSSSFSNQLITVAMTFFLTVIVITCDYRHARVYLKENRTSWANVPESMVSYMSQQYIGGNIFNAYNLGGFLGYRLAPRFRVFIDGRTNILYPWELAERHNAALASSEAFLSEVENYDIEFSILQANTENVERMARAGFELDFADVHYLLFHRESGRFNELGNLWSRPYCWDQTRIQNLDSEVKKARSILLQQNALRPLTDLAAGFISSDDPTEYLENYPEARLSTVESTRFYAYRALEKKLYAPAINQLLRLSQPAPKDKLALVLAYIGVRDINMANTQMSKIISEFKSWPNVGEEDLVVLQALLELLSTHSPIEYVPQGLLEELDMTVGNNSVASDKENRILASFCGN